MGGTEAFQFGLFVKPSRPAVAPAAPEQTRQLARVTGRIGESVLAFCRARVGQTFRAADLAAFVMSDCGGAPASADRVMRQLRAQGFIDVQVEDRAGSLYRVRAAAGASNDGP
jgi:hypothetical protein